MAGQVDSYKFTVRQMESHRYEISAGPAPKLQNAATVDRRRAHSAEKGDSREPTRVRLWKTDTRIQDLIVCTLKAGFHGALYRELQGRRPASEKLGTAHKSHRSYRSHEARQRSLPSGKDKQPMKRKQDPPVV